MNTTTCTPRSQLSDPHILAESEDTIFVALRSGIDGHWPTILDFYKLRAEIFVDRLSWPSLTKSNGMEIDEYDSSETTYLFLLNRQNCSILGAVRVCPTDSEFFASPMAQYPTSYMLRDAHLGRLDEFTDPICYADLPQRANTIELSRLISTHPSYLSPIIRQTSNYFAAQGITSCLMLGSPTFIRIGRRMGYEVSRLSDDYKTGQSKFCAMAYDPRGKDYASNE